MAFCISANSPADFTWRMALITPVMSRTLADGTARFSHSLQIVQVRIAFLLLPGHKRIEIGIDLGQLLELAP